MNPGDLADLIVTHLDGHVRSPTQEHSRMCSCGVVVEPGKWHRHLADSIIAAMTREEGGSGS